MASQRRVPTPTPPQIQVPPGSWAKDEAHSGSLPSPFATSLPDHTAEAFAEMAARFGLLVETVHTATIGYETYVQVVPVGGGGGPTPPRPVLWALVRVVPALRRRMAAAKLTLRDGLLDLPAARWEAEQRLDLERRLDDLAAVDLRALDEAGLLDQLAAVLELARDGVHVHFQLFLPYLVGVHGLVDVCDRLLGWDTARALQLLTGSSEASAEPTRALASVADAVRRHPVALAAVRDRSPGLQARLEAASPALGRDLRAWVARWGHRCLDYEPAAPTIAEQPELVAQLLRESVAASARPASTGGGDLVEEARDRLSGAGRDEFQAAVTQARRVHPLREGNVHLTATMPAAAVRRVLREIGRRLAGVDLLAAPDDVFLCHHDEIVAALRSGTVDLRDVVERRRDEMAWVEEHPGPQQYGPPDGDPPDLSVLPVPARRLNTALMWAVEQEFAPPPEARDDGGGVLRGLPGAPGQATGRVRLVCTDEDLSAVEDGDVVVCRIATTSWSVVLGVAGAIVCDGGGALSHAAIVARELGIPAVLGTSVATRTLRDGQLVTVDGGAGTVVAE